MDDKIKALASKYRLYREGADSIRQSIKTLYTRYIKEYEQSLLDAVSSSAAVDALFLADQIDYSKITPQMAEAFKLAYPNVDFSSLADRSPDEIYGFINSWKGKYFEVLVRDKLNAGDWVGDIHLNTGQYAELAHSATQRGWDLQIFDSHDHVLDSLQLKATDSLGYIKKALETYPNIDVISTDDVINHASNVSDHIFASGITEDSLRESVQAPIETLLDSQFGEFMEDVLPFLPFIIITVGEGRKVMMGKKSFEMALSDAVFRAIKSGAAIGVGAFVVFLDGGLLSIPATFLTRVGFDRFRIMNSLNKKINQKIESIKVLRADYSY